MGRSEEESRLLGRIRMATLFMSGTVVNDISLDHCALRRQVACFLHEFGIGCMG